MAGVAGALVALELAVATRYGWHRDELYFREMGRHLAWGYVDQPPFTPLVARAADLIAPDDLLALRATSAVTVGATVVVAALLARELGGDGRAQVLASLAMASGGFLLGVGHLLSTATFDLFAWMVLLWLAARLLRTGDPRWWLAFGAVAGVSLLNKNLLVLLGGALGVGLVVERRWDLLRTPWVVAGAALAAAIAAPNLWWQAQNGWPQLEMARVLSERIGTENRLMLLPLQPVLVGLPLVPILWRGAVGLRDDPDLHRFRALLWAWPAGAVLGLATGARPYYILPLTLTVLVAGSVTSADRPAVPWLVALSAVTAIPVALPVLPPASVRVTAAVNETSAETIGWPEMVDQVAEVVDRLPPEERRSVVLIGGTYGEAGAIDRFGGGHGLPPAHSPHNGYAGIRVPEADDATVVAIRIAPERLSRWFDDCEQVGTVVAPHDVDNEVQGAPISVCRGLRGTWADTWEDMRFLA